MPIMLATMDHHPDRAAQVLEATFKDGCAPHWAVSDVLCFLVKWSSQLPAPDRKKQQAALPGLVLYLLRNSRPKSLCFQQWVLGQVISVCDARAAAELCSALEAYSHRLHFNTKLKLADRLAKDRRYTLLALRLLESVISDDGLSANDRRCAALATLLFKLPQTTWGTGRAPPVEINLIAESYERLVGLGFSPNAITSTTLIHSLCSADQLDTAFKIYDVMRGQWTDDRVFFPLVQAARRSGSLEAIIRVFQHAPSNVLQHRRIWDNLIHAIHVAAKKEAKFKGYKYNHGNPAFRSMLQVYCKFFDLAPLQRLIPWDLHRYLEEPDRNSASDNWDFKVKLALFIDKLPVLPTGRAMNPGTITLTTMLLGYLRTFPKAIRAIEFYSHFRNLLRDRDTTAIRLLRDTTLPYDVVLKSLAEHAGTLRVMTDIVKTMLADAAKSAAARKQAAGRVAVAAAVPSNSKPRAAPEAAVSPENDASPEEKSRDQNEQDGAAVSSRSKPAEPTLKPLYHPPPSVCTWSILLYAFSRERGPRNAARILGLMRANNIEPNRATWNTVANSYGRVQDKKRVSGALHMLETTGFHPDVHTIRAVAQLRGYEDVLDQMETRMEQRGEAHMQMVAELAKPPITLIEKWNAERARREAEALSGVPEGQEQQQQQLEQEVICEDAGAKQSVADAELEASLKELEDAHEAMLRAAEAAARENPVSKTVPAAVRAAKKRSARGVSAEPDSEEIAAYMEMYDELVFEQMKEELTGFNTKGGEKAREAGDTEQDSASVGAEITQQAP
jgi:pentatricopeptide repeat protein